MYSAGPIQTTKQSHRLCEEGLELRALQAPRVLHSPRVPLVRAWRYLIELRIDDAWQMIAQLEEILAGSNDAHGPRYREFAELLKAIACVLTSRKVEAICQALTIIERRRRSEARSPALSAALRIGYWKARDMDRYYAVPHCRGNHGFASIAALSFEALAEAEQLRLAVATKLASSAHERAVTRFGKPTPVTGRCAVVLSELLFETGHRAGLDSLIMDSLAAVRASGDQECALRGYRLLSRLAERRGYQEFAFLILREAEALAIARDWAGMLAEVCLLRMQLLLKESRAAEALLCLDRIGKLARSRLGMSDEKLHECHALAQAHMLIATGEAQAGANILRELHAANCIQQNNYTALRLSVQLANALLASDERPEGRALLIWALQVGARAGIYETFVDAGEHAAELLRSLHLTPPQEAGLPVEFHPYLESILSDRAFIPSGSKSRRVVHVAESLSPRERTILRSMSSGRSTKQIAQDLHIAPETVKTHVKGIFVKLAVQTRAHAVSAANALGLL